ncbi:cuticle collagen 8-like [Manacus candei]|uniref:cuticle collagen 8-like n=1 Tax=Manacus candei TaxID=415023 RepID=UPI0022268628|nr:cuticle collagen 8-like [Manacus candei]
MMLRFTARFFFLPAWVILPSPPGDGTRGGPAGPSRSLRASAPSVPAAAAAHAPAAILRCPRRARSRRRASRDRAIGREPSRERGPRPARAGKGGAGSGNWALGTGAAGSARPRAPGRADTQRARAPPRPRGSRRFSNAPPSTAPRRAPVPSSEPNPRGLPGRGAAEGGWCWTYLAFLEPKHTATHIINPKNPAWRHSVSLLSRFKLSL